MLFSTLGMVLADEAGTKAIWGLKGSGSWRLCARCANVVNARWGFEETGGIVLHTETSTRKLRLHSDESVFAIIDKLQGVSDNKTRLAELEKINGFNHEPHGVLQCVQLRSVVRPECITYDFMHCFVTNGALDYELQLYWRECLSQKLLTLEAMKTWMQCLNWPRRLGGRPTEMWSAYHTGEDEYYGGCASSLLSFYPAFRDLITRVIPAHEMVPQTRSLLALFRVVDGWYVYLHTRRAPPRWQEHISTWMQAAQVAWPDMTWKPKHHYCLHMPEFIDRFGILPSTFATERRHKLYKAMSPKVKQSKEKFEFSLMVSLVGEHLESLQEDDSLEDEKLIEGHLDSGDLSQILQEHVKAVSFQAQVAGKVLKARDMVWHSMGTGAFSVAEVVFFVEIEAAACLHCVVRPYHQVGQVWVRQEVMCRIESSSVVDAGIWAESTGGRRVLLPPRLQYFV